MFEGHLATAERHVAEGEVHLAKQRALIQKLQQDGHDVTLANSILLSMEEGQASHVADRDQIRAELEK